MYTEITKFPKILFLLLMFTFANFMALFITPALPEIAKDFNVAPSTATFLMSIFLIGYSIGLLPYGPLANRWGRKGAFTIGSAIALSGTVLAVFSTSFTMLCAARLFQAIGASAGLSVVFTMIGDVHTGEKAAKAVATISLSFGFIPALSIATGGIVTTLIGWQGCFYFLSLYAVFIWLLSRLFPETAKEIQKDALQIKKIGAGYFNQMKDPYIILHAFLAGLATASIYIFVTISPYIGIEKIGLRPDEFGLWAMVPSFGLLVGAFIAKRLSSINPRVVMISGILIFFLSIATLSLLFVKGYMTVWSLFIPAFFMNIGNNLTWSRSLSQGLSCAADKSNASAVMQSVSVGTATIAVFLVELARPTATMLLPLSFSVITLLLLTVWFILKKIQESGKVF